MTLSLSYSLVILSCVVFSVKADVSHLGYNRYNGNRVSSLRLQRLESHPTPYPSAGYRPNREFNLPQEQPLFPFPNQQFNTQQQTSNGFDNLNEPQQKPQLIYGAPAGGETQNFPQQTLNQRPQYSNGFNNLAEGEQQPQQKPQLVYGAPAGGETQSFPQQSLNQRPQNSNGFNNLAEGQQQPAFNGVNGAEENEFEAGKGFNNLAEPQKQPELLYATPNGQEQQNSGFENLSEPQQNPQYNYNTPARLRQLLIARLQQAQAQTQLQPQNLYSAPAAQQQQVQQQILTETQSQAESQPSRLTNAAKSARLTDNREEREEETAESDLDIETTTKKDNSHKSTNGTAIAVSPIPAAANSVVSYYPATAFSFVQPFSAAYVAASNYHTVQPVTAAYTLGSPFFPQQYAFNPAPAQLQAW